MTRKVGCPFLGDSVSNTIALQRKKDLVVSVPSLIPLPILALEIGTPVDVLASKLGEAVTVDDIGLRCVPAENAREFISAHRAATRIRREREVAERAVSAAAKHPDRERVRALKRAQKRFDDSDLPALARMSAADIEAKAELSARHLDELMSGECHYHSLRDGTDR